LHGIPVWLTRKTLPKIETKPGQTVFALMDRLQRFDERVGCTFGWYFFMLHGNRIGSSVGEPILCDLCRARATFLSVIYIRCRRI
jgi:hypothetical protein